MKHIKTLLKKQVQIKIEGKWVLKVECCLVLIGNVKPTVSLPRTIDFPTWQPETQPRKWQNYLQVWWFVHTESGCLLVLPHLSCCCHLQEWSWATPLTWLVFACIALRAVGVDWGLSGVFELLSHLPITKGLFFLFAATQQLSPFIPPLNSPLFLS